MSQMFTLVRVGETEGGRRTMISRVGFPEQKLLKRGGRRGFGILECQLQLQVADVQFVGRFERIGNPPKIVGFVTIERPCLGGPEVVAGGHVSQECLHSMS